MLPRTCAALLGGAILAIALADDSVATVRASSSEGLVVAGMTKYFGKDFHGSIASLNHAVRLGCQDPRCFYFRGLAYAKLGKPSWSVADYRHAARLEAADLGWLRKVGQALTRVQGAERLAIEQARQRALAENPPLKEELLAAQYHTVPVRRDSPAASFARVPSGPVRRVEVPRPEPTSTEPALASAPARKPKPEAALRLGHPRPLARRPLPPAAKPRAYDPLDDLETTAPAVAAQANVAQAIADSPRGVLPQGETAAAFTSPGTAPNASAATVAAATEAALLAKTEAALPANDAPATTVSVLVTIPQPVAVPAPDLVSPPLVVAQPVASTLAPPRLVTVSVTVGPTAASPAIPAMTTDSVAASPSAAPDTISSLCINVVAGMSLLGLLLFVGGTTYQLRQPRVALSTMWHGSRFETRPVARPAPALTCPVCRQELAGRTCRCPRCRTPHHHECWEYNQGCSRYACGVRVSAAEADWR